MGQGPDRVVEVEATSTHGSTPFVLWEGGRTRASSEGLPTTPSDEVLGLAPEAQMPLPEMLERRDVEGAVVGSPGFADEDQSAEPRGHWAGMSTTRPSPDWRLVWASLLLFLAIATGALVARNAFLDMAYVDLRWEDHTVVAGETIGSILAERDLPDVGLGRLVTWVEERNGLPSATIEPGQTLSIPR